MHKVLLKQIGELLDALEKRNYKAYQKIEKELDMIETEVLLALRRNPAD